MIKVSLRVIFVASFSMLLLSCKSKNDPITSIISTEPRDSEGYLYRTIKIGSKTWFAENLKTTKYKNGGVIENVTDALDWSSKTSGALRESKNPLSFGYLYNYAAISDLRGICPNGWHVATEDDFDLLITTAGGLNKSAYNLKTYTSDWASPNENNVNTTNPDSLGFTAKANGFIALNGVVSQENNTAGFWTSTPSAIVNRTRAFDMYSNSKILQVYDANRNIGLSCRCVKD